MTGKSKEISMVRAQPAVAEAVGHHFVNVPKSRSLQVLLVEVKILVKMEWKTS